jgi:hypothetical protein
MRVNSYLTRDLTRAVCKESGCFPVIPLEGLFLAKEVVVFATVELGIGCA